MTPTNVPPGWWTEIKISTCVKDIDKGPSATSKGNIYYLLASGFREKRGRNCNDISTIMIHMDSNNQIRVDFLSFPVSQQIKKTRSSASAKSK